MKNLAAALTRTRHVIHCRTDTSLPPHTPPYSVLTLLPLPLPILSEYSKSLRPRAEAFALYYAFFAECSNLVVAVAEDGFKYLIRVLSEAWAATPDHAG